MNHLLAHSEQIDRQQASTEKTQLTEWMNHKIHVVQRKKDHKTQRAKLQPGQVIDSVMLLILTFNIDSSNH